MDNLLRIEEEKDILIGELKEVKETLEGNMKEAQEEANEYVVLLEERKYLIEELQSQCEDFKERITKSEMNFEKLTETYEALQKEQDVSIPILNSY